MNRNTHITIAEAIAQAGNTIHLSRAERDGLRERVHEYVLYKPQRDGSTRTQRVHDSVAPWHIFGARSISAFLVGGLILSGAGVSSAAENSLPGDLLYSVKVNINEEVVSVLTADPVERAIWEASRAERRLSEVGSLAQAGLLDVDTATAVAEAFNEQADKAVTLVAALSKDDPFAAAEVSTEIETALESHEVILGSLDHIASSTRDLVEQTRSHAIRIAEVRAEAEAEFIPERLAVVEDVAPETMAMTSVAASESVFEVASVTPEVAGDVLSKIAADVPTPVIDIEMSRKAAVRMRAAAQRELARLSDIPADNFNEIESLQLAIQGDIDAGSSALVADDPALAYELFQTALVRAARADRLLSAEAALNIELPVEEDFERVEENSLPQDVQEFSPTDIESMQAAAADALESFKRLTFESGDAGSSEVALVASATLDTGVALVESGDSVGAGRAFQKVIDILRSTTTSGVGPFVDNQIEHRILGDVHVFSGSIMTPGKCAVVGAEALPGKSTSSIALFITWEENNNDCLGESTKVSFEATIAATPTDLLEEVYVNGIQYAPEIYTHESATL
jgi:hypothetical protein